MSHIERRTEGKGFEEEEVLVEVQEPGKEGGKKGGKGKGWAGSGPVGAAAP